MSRRNVSNRSNRYKSLRKRVHLFEGLEPRLLMNSHWQNPARPTDINNDRMTTPLDALLVIDRLMKTGLGTFPVRNNKLDYYYDVNGDQVSAPVDVLYVIDALRQRSTSEPARIEGEAESGPAGFISIPMRTLLGTIGQVVTIDTTLNIGREEFNEMGLFVVDGPDGAVNGILPSSPDYASAVFQSNQRQVLYSKAGTFRSASGSVFPAGKLVHVYVLQPSSDNGDAAAHLRARDTGTNKMRVGWEQQPSLTPGWQQVGDRGYDDVIVDINIGLPVDSHAEPVITAIPNQSINEQTLLSVQAITMDADGPNDSLQYTLDIAPNGATIDPATGLFRWTPSEDQGPGNFEVVIRATDSFGLFDTESFFVTVLEVNRPPVLQPIANQQVLVGQTVSFTASASDPDLPSNTVTYSLLAGAPSGARIDSTTGSFTWTVPTGATSGDYAVSIRATDNGRPALSDTKTFNINVGCAFDANLSSWTIFESGGTREGKGTVTSNECKAVIREGDSFVVGLERSFTIPFVPSALRVRFEQPLFDTSSSGFIKDAFEVAFVDASGFSLLTPYASARDAYFNITEGLPPRTGGSSVSIEGNTMLVNLADVPGGTQGRLVFRLVNNDSDTNSTVTINQAELITTSDAITPAKFFVADASAGIFRHAADGRFLGTFAAGLITGELRGATSIADGTSLWTIATNGTVYVQNSDGSVRGSWMANGLVAPQGVEVLGQDVWIVDSSTDRVLKYTGGAALTNGSASPSFTFSLAANNTSPMDVASDGTRLFVVDDSVDRVFVYSLTGAYLGDWQLDSAIADASDLTTNPAGGTELWVLDRMKRQVFQYDRGTTYLTGSFPFNSSFSLASGNIRPEGLADPPQTPAGHSQLEPDGRAVFDTADDFRQGTLFNLTAVDSIGEVRLNSSDQTEFANIIWIANSGEGTISKVDTVTGKELGRYRTGQEGTPLYPNRTGVTSRGDVWVNNREQALGTMVKILHEGFVDRNGNGVLDTSFDRNGDGRIGSDEILSWDANGDGQPDDERISMVIPVGWDRVNRTQQVPGAMGRSLVVDENDNVWVGFWNARQYEFYDGNSGERRAIVPVDGTPYNAAIDSNGVLWSTSAQLTPIIDRIDTRNFSHLGSISNQGGTRGITIDQQGIIWFGAWEGTVVRHDPIAGTWDTYSAGFNATSGVAVDSKGRVWAGSFDSGVTRLTFAEDRRTLVETRRLSLAGGTPSAVFDSDKFFWTIALSANSAYKIDPESVTVVDGYPIATGREPYNYTNNTAQVRATVTQRTGRWTEIIDGGRNGTVWGGVGLDSLQPPGTDATVRVRASSTAAALQSLAWREVSTDTVIQELAGRYLEVEVSLTSARAELNPSVQSVTVTSIAPPQLQVRQPEENAVFASLTPLILDGVATASQPEFGPSLRASNRIVGVTINGEPVDVLDSEGRFYSRVAVRPGENSFIVVATDAFGQSTTVTRTIFGESKVQGNVDVSELVDVSAGFQAEYGRTSFREREKELYADFAVRNISQYPAGVPLYVAVKNISDPAVRALNADGTLPDGAPYYDFTGLVTGGAKALAPNAATGMLSLAFANPNRGRFTYELVFLGVPNRPPVFTSVPELEATVGRQYQYAAAATDPDSDPLRFMLVTGPTGMTVNETTGTLTWTPSASQLGNMPVTLRVSDGRGGIAEQAFTVVSAALRPNRPPVFTSLPIGEAQAGQSYTYDVDAADPDGDTLRYSLAAGFPTGMTINQSTGMISWTPAFNQLGDADIVVIADDGRGGTAQQSFTICVTNNANRPPVIVSEPVRTARPIQLVEREVIQYEGEWKYQVVGFGQVPGFEQPQFDDSVFSTGLGGFGSGGGCLLNRTARKTTWPVNTDILLRKTIVLPAAATQLAVRGAIDNDIQIFVNGVEVSQGMQTSEGCAERNEFRVIAPDSLLRVGENVIAVRARDRGAESYVDVTVTAELPKDWTSTLPPTEIGEYHYQVAALDPDGSALSFSLSQQPSGMTIDTTTGLIKWLPSENVAGQSFPLSVRVDDGRGGSDEQSFTVRVLGNAGPREFDPVVEWQKGQFTLRPNSNQVMMTPAVIDVNQDGVADIVFSTFGDQGIGGGNSPGVLRAISGKGGEDLWSVVDSSWMVEGFAGIAAGDVDGDGRPEIFASDPSQSRIVAFRSDGTGWWISPQIPGGIRWGSAAIADLDQDGSPEIIVGATVLNRDGSIRWSGAGGRGDNGVGPLTLVADLDRDGKPEIVAGRTAYRADGSVYWNAPINDGFPAVGNFDSDLFPEVALVSGGTVSLLEHNGVLKWGPFSVPGGGTSGAPTIADFDNDGMPEIGVAGASRYVVFETDGSVRWQSGTQDFSSNVTGSSVFDFDGDGAAEVVYGDERFLRVYDGATGTIRYSLPNPSGTTYEYPVIADVDGDGNAEIVVVANNYSAPGFTGIRVIGDRNNTWVNARTIWNQHTYHITNINDDGSIPRNEANSWELYNTYRTNVLTEGVDPRAAVDLTVQSLSRVGNASPLTFSAKVANIGNAPVNAGVTLALIDGNPAKGGVRVGSQVTTQRLKAGESETLTISISAETVNDLWAVIDPDNLIPEFDDDNNALRGAIDTDSTNYTPQIWHEIPSAQRTVAANEKLRLTLPVVDPDGDGITYSVLTGPEGLMVHPTLGVVAWVPKRNQIGEHQILVKATDAGGNVRLVPFDLTVLAPNTAPVVTSTAPEGPANVGLPFEYRVSAQDAESDTATLRYSLRDALPGMTIGATSGVFSWTPTSAQSGSRTIHVVVSDGTATTEQSFTLTAQATATNRNPLSAISTADTSAWLGRKYGAVVVASDPDGDPVRFELVAGPTGMIVDPVHGFIEWIPSAVTATPIPVEVRANDGRGGSSSVAFTLSVYATDQNRVPRIISNPPSTALHSGVYAYDLEARDPDGDAVFWQLVIAPLGVSIDAGRGTLRWVPAGDQIGTHTITVRATDPLGAQSEQTFTVVVTCENQPPNFVSRPQTVAFANEPYVYAVRAVDPEGDALTYSLVSGPAGMSFAPGTSLLRWTPTLAQAGPQTVVLKATDAAGNEAQQSFSVVVSTESPNRPPVITSQPRLGATLGRAYTYSVVARDPDGDALTYTLREKPDGMQVTPAGVITWTPTIGGSSIVTVEVTDGRGGIAVQTYSLTARANQAPVITPLPDSDTTAGATFRAQVRATDPENDPLTFTLDRAPAGMSIDSQGRIFWTATGSPRTESVAVTVTDSDGLTATDEFFLRLVEDDNAPNVRIVLSAEQVNVGTSVRIQVTATDNVGVQSLSLTANGVAVALDSQGHATLPTTAAGQIAFVATATDISNNTGTATAQLRVVDPNAVSDVQASFTRLEMLTAPGQFQSIPIDDNTSPDISYLADVYGTISSTGQPLSFWRLIYARGAEVDILNPDVRSSAWREISRGTTTLTNAKLGTFDPTMLSNDNYVLAIEAYDITGGGYVKPTEVNVVGNAKLGNFRLEFTDLTIPLVGIPIQITRVYDTLDADTEADFGYGWRLGIEDGKIFEAGAIGRGGALTGGEDNFVPDRTKVYITNPAGQRVGFTYKERLISASFFGGIWAPYFQPDPGVYDTLTIDETQVPRGGIIGALAEGINPAFYTLTTKDGVKYRYHDKRGLETITDRNGNTVTYTFTGIKHSSGQEITFVRDSRGRIREIVDPAGKKLIYEYNAAGDLVKLTNQEQLTTRYAYLSSPAHYLDEAYDSLGKRTLKVQYDSNKRFIGVFDALGNQIDRRDYDLLNNKGIVRDGNGNPTTLIYDARGNVLEEIDPLGNKTLRRYEDPRNPDSETTVIDRRGMVTERAYDERGNLLSITEKGSQTSPLATPVVTSFRYNSRNDVASINNALGSTTGFEYDSAGRVTKITNALGHSSTFTFDSKGQRTSFTDFNGNKTTFDYEAACPCGSPSKVTHADGTYQTFQYNQFGQVTLEQTFEANGTLVERKQTEYDASGRVTRELIGGGNDPNHPPTDFRKFYNGHLLAWEVIVSPQSLNSSGVLIESPATPVAQRKSRLTEYKYDERDNLITQIDAMGGIVDFRYDAQGNRVLLRDPIGNITTWTYDSLNRVAEERDPFYWVAFVQANASLSTEALLAAVVEENKKPSAASIAINQGAPHVRSFAYDAEGNQSKMIDRNNRRREFAYDHAGRLLEERWYTPINHTTAPGVLVETISFTYDKLGNMLTAADSNSRYWHTYDVLNRLTSVDNNPLDDRDVPRVILSYDYDAQGNVISTSDDAGVTVASEYDKRNRLRIRRWFDADVPAGETRDVADARVDFLYTAAGREREVRRYSDLDGTNLAGRSLRTYDVAGRSYLLTHVNAVDEVLAGYDYDYDFSGLLVNETRTHQDPQYAQEIEYKYSLNAQLVEALFSGQNDEYYQYDANGNRVGGDYTTGPANQQLTDDRYQYTYDGEGNLSTKTDISTGNSTAYAWDHRNRLVKVETQSKGGIVISLSEFMYDAENKRIAQTQNGSTLNTNFNGDNTWTNHSELTEQSTHFLFGDGVDEVLAKSDLNNPTNWHLSDKLGTIRDTISSSNTTVNRIEYTTFGQILSQLHVDANDQFAFTGREWNPILGDYFYRARYYNPSIGRFISNDPIGCLSGDKNYYRYVLNSPLNYVDAYGLMAIENAMVIRSVSIPSAVAMKVLSTATVVVLAHLIANMWSGNHDPKCPVPCLLPAHIEFDPTGPSENCPGPHIHISRYIQDRRDCSCRPAPHHSRNSITLCLPTIF